LLQQKPTDGSWSRTEKRLCGPPPSTRTQWLTLHRALDIARRKRAEGDIAGAVKFARKSQLLFSNPQAEAFLASLADAPTSPDSTPLASGTSTPTSNGEGTTSQRKARIHTEHRPGRQDSQYTVEQLAIVQRVRKCKHHQYYEILELETKATDSEIKKRCATIDSFGGVVLISVIESWRCNYILIRTELLAPTRLSKVICCL